LPCLAALVAGTLLTAALSPLDLWGLVLLCFALLFYLVQTATPGQSLVRGFCFGMGLYGTGSSWVYVSIHEYGAASPLLAGFLTLLLVVGLTLLFILPPLWLFARLNRTETLHLRPIRAALLFSALWVIAEWCRSWLLTGFPWLLSGYALLDTPARGLAPLTGVYGLGFLAVVSGALLAVFFQATSQSIHDRWGRTALTGARDTFRLANPRKLALTALLIPLMLWTAAGLLQHAVWVAKTGTPLKVSAVQANIPQHLKWAPGHLEHTLQTYARLSQDHWNSDLLIWSENSIPILHDHAGPFIDQLTIKTMQTGTTLLSGIPYSRKSRGNISYYNGILALGEAGPQHYFKQRLVPFGEYVPLESWLRGLIAFFDLPMSNFRTGPAGQAPIRAGSARIGASICYEIVYPDLIAASARQANLLVTLSNDTWFGRSLGPRQHFQMARMRALENGRYLIRSTNDGITAIIDPQGTVTSRLPRFTADTLRGQVHTMSGHTPYTRFGSWPVVLLCTLVCIVLCRKNLSIRGRCKSPKA
jgi:apolipoprotein N-acyltransferase